MHYLICRARLVAVILLTCLLLPASVIAAESETKTLTGAQAQKSPQADVMLAFERAMIEDGIEAAGAHATPGKLEDLRLMLKQIGDAGYKQFQAEMRGVPRGEARRKQIEKLMVTGDKAVISARSGPNAIDEIPLLRTPEGWKVSLRSE